MKPKQQVSSDDGKSTMPKRRKSLKKKVIFFAIAWFLILLMACTVGELAVRISRGKLLSFESVHRTRVEFNRSIPVDHHTEFGWLPRPGEFKSEDGWPYNMTNDKYRFRNHGTTFQPSNPHIFAVGDSYAYGDEVGDRETWPFHLENLLGHPVVNAGVSGYGFDQAIMRAESLIDKYEAGIVVLTGIGHDIERTQFSYFNAWKPYYTIENEKLELHNVPVPTEPWSVPFSGLRDALGYSQLADVVFSKVAWEWWLFGGIQQWEHFQGEEVTCMLLSRLKRKTDASGSRLLFVTVCGRSDLGNHALDPVVVHAENIGIDVLHLVPKLNEMAKQDSTLAQTMFCPHNHLSAKGNRWFATQVFNKIQKMKVKGLENETSSVSSQR